jgi:hypothetical protein
MVIVLPYPSWLKSNSRADFAFHASHHFERCEAATWEVATSQRSKW